VCSNPTCDIYKENSVNNLKPNSWSRTPLAALCALAMLPSLSLAQTQSIPVPASSLAGSTRAVVAVTQPNMSNYATKTEVNNAYNYAASAYSYAGQAYSKADASSAWAKNFAGQQKGHTAHQYAYGGAFYTNIDGNGYVSVYDPALGWRGVGYTYANTPLSYNGGGAATATFYIYPVGATGDGRPAGWVTNASYITNWADGSSTSVSY
jgi:hypothetical protein